MILTDYEPSYVAGVFDNYKQAADFLEEVSAGQQRINGQTAVWHGDEVELIEMNLNEAQEHLKN